MQIKAVFTLGCRVIARLRSSALILYRPKFASVIAMTNHSSTVGCTISRLVCHVCLYQDAPASNLARSLTDFSMASTVLAISMKVFKKKRNMHRYNPLQMSTVSSSPSSARPSNDHGAQQEEHSPTPEVPRASRHTVKNGKYDLSRNQ